jgi:protocatechuate 3,4-dioxygenase beta subunit
MLYFADPRVTFAEGAAPTPQCHDNDEATIRQTEGPYFKPRSPERPDLVEPGTKGRLVEISGQVLTRSCRPVERALIDLWHADEYGGFRGSRRLRCLEFGAVTDGCSYIHFGRIVIADLPRTVRGVD